MPKLAKQYIAAFVLLITSIPALAAGPYDGIWVADEEPNAGYLMVMEKDGQVIVAGLGRPDEDEDRLTWGAESGFRQNNTVRLYTIVSDTTSTIVDVTMTSPTTGTVTLLYCESVSPDWECSKPAGSQYHIRKIW